MKVNVYISDDIKTDLFTPLLLNCETYLIACIRTGQGHIQYPFNHLWWNFLQK